jgi:hypothetical protein
MKRFIKDFLKVFLILCFLFGSIIGLILSMNYNPWVGLVSCLAFVSFIAATTNMDLGDL